MDVVARSRALDSEGRRLLEVGGNSLDVVVPTCPGWDMRQLVGHVTHVWQLIAETMAGGSLEPPDFSALEPIPTDDEELLAAAVGGLERLVAAVEAADPTQPVWTWSADTTMGFFLRRSHLETLVHRVDAEIATDQRSLVDPASALDGIDELVSVLLAPTGDDLPRGSLHLHRSDGEGEFMLAVASGAVVVTNEHAKGDAALRGSAEDLWLTMWGRRSAEGLEAFGDATVISQWTRLAP